MKLVKMSDQFNSTLTLRNELNKAEISDSTESPNVLRGSDKT